MKIIKINAFCSLVLLLFLISSAAAQIKSEILTGDSLVRIVPTGFYFAGQSAQTQMRNSSAARLDENRFIIAGLVDTSGYSTDISGKYEGFLITDSPIKIGDKLLNTGAYGFGFDKEKINIFDLSSKQILSVAIKSDAAMKRPRPLLMTTDESRKGIRFYKGRNYILISAN